MLKTESFKMHAAALILLEKDGGYLFIRRIHTKWMNGYYSLPGGRVESGEGFMMAAIREAKEEVGVIIKPSCVRHAVTLWRHEADEPAMEWCDVVFVADTWDGTPSNMEPNLHDEIIWLSPQSLPDNVIPSVKRMIALFEAGKPYGEYNQFIAK